MWRTGISTTKSRVLYLPDKPWQAGVRNISISRFTIAFNCFHSILQLFVYGLHILLLRDFYVTTFLKADSVSCLRPAGVRKEDFALKMVSALPAAATVYPQIIGKY
jgi:hypothetical protein